MTTLDYQEFVDLAVELVQFAGRRVKIHKLKATAVDPTKPWKGAGSPASIEATAQPFAVFLPASGSDLGKVIKREELLARVEQVALVHPVTVPLDGFHVIEDGGTKWAIEWAEVLAPGDTTVLYAFGIKR